MFRVNSQHVGHIFRGMAAICVTQTCADEPIYEASDLPPLAFVGSFTWRWRQEYCHLLICGKPCEKLYGVPNLHCLSFVLAGWFVPAFRHHLSEYVYCLLCR